MEVIRFDAIARSLNGFFFRRHVLRGLAAAGLGLAAFPGWPRGEFAVDAKKKRKHKRKKNKQPPQLSPSPPPPPPFNEFGCLDVGQPCQGDSTLCCSGICDPGSTTCVAHDSGVCFQDTDTCTLGQQFHCSQSNSHCSCVVTTGTAGFCGDFSVGPFCRLCSQDTDCQEEFGPGAACVVLRSLCSPICAATGRTACVPPCA